MFDRFFFPSLTREFNCFPLFLRESEFPQAVTTFMILAQDRPRRLVRTLEHLLPLQIPILVVHGGVASRFQAEYASICSAYSVGLMQLPGPRSLAQAWQTGLSYWLGDPKVEWISCFQEEVEVSSDFMERLALVQDAVRRPLLGGRVDSSKPCGRVQSVQGTPIHLCPELISPHYHAHRNYWMRHLGQIVDGRPEKKTRRRGDGFYLSKDRWHFRASKRRWGTPRSSVAVVPNLVRISTVLPAEATWGTPALPDPALSRSRDDGRRGAVPTHFGETLAQCFGQNQEGASHPHAREERGELYHCIDSGSTELEVLNFLHALVCLFKPNLILETGTYLGFGSCSLASGLKANGSGRLITIERDETRRVWAMDHVRQFDADLLSRIDFVRDSTLTYLESYSGPPFDFSFLDSALEIRMEELHLLCHRELLSPGAICLIHDTSPWRLEGTGGGSAASFQNRDDFSSLGPCFEVFQFPYSRGFHLIRYAGPAAT